MNKISGFVDQIAELANKKKIRISTAESCTGGWIAKALTDKAGSSAWFELGLVTYSNAMKTRFLHVDEQVLTEHGAVSQPVVLAMSEGALAQSGADYSVSVSGIAGPDGGSASKPVGTVWIAWAGKNGARRSQCFVFSGGRDEIRRQTVEMALQQLTVFIQSPEMDTKT